MTTYSIIKSDTPIWYETELDITSKDPRWRTIMDYDDKLCLSIPEEIYGMFVSLGHTNEFLEFEFYGVTTWSKKQIDIAKSDAKYWLKNLDLAMNNTKHSPNIENWYPVEEWKKVNNTDKYQMWLPFTKELLQTWLEEFVYFLDQADSSVVVHGD
jgi:hypothetical protein